jgi:GT2 family glycosyltransferase
MSSKVLIGITSKDRYTILPKAIDSAINQTYPDKEIAVYDDHSTDATETLAVQYADVKWYFSKTEHGYLFGRNMFLENTDAEYYCSLDDDSWFLSDNHLQQAIEYMNASPSVAVLAFKILSDDLRKEIKRGNSIVETNNFIGCGHMLRVSAVRSVGNYTVNPGYYGGEEKDLCIRLIDKGYSIIRFPEVEIWHDKTTLSRDSVRQHRSSVCNDLVFAYRRIPGLILLPIFLYKLFSNLRFALFYKKGLFVKPCLKGMGDFFKFLFSGNVNRKAVKMSTYRKFIHLN